MVTKKKSVKKSSKRTPAKSVKSSPHLFMFHGLECPHCRNMDEIVRKIERKFKIHIAVLEVWHNEKNAALLETLDNGKCGGVPFFWNAKSKEWICGEADEQELIAWAKGK